MAKDKLTPEQDGKTGRFLAGNSGNGWRLKGSRNKLGEAFIADVYAIWQANGAESLEELRQKDVAAFVRIVAGILPKELVVNNDFFGELTLQQMEEYTAILEGIVERSRTDEESSEVSFQKNPTAH